MLCVSDKNITQYLMIPSMLCARQLSIRPQKWSARAKNIFWIAMRPFNSNPTTLFSKKKSLFVRGRPQWLPPDLWPEKDPLGRPDLRVKKLYPFDKSGVRMPQPPYNKKVFRLLPCGPHGLAVSRGLGCSTAQIVCARVNRRGGTLAADKHYPHLPTPAISNLNLRENLGP